MELVLNTVFFNYFFFAIVSLSVVEDLFCNLLKRLSFDYAQDDIFLVSRNDVSHDRHSRAGGNLNTQTIAKALRFPIKLGMTT